MIEWFYNLDNLEQLEQLEKLEKILDKKQKFKADFVYFSVWYKKCRWSIISNGLQCCLFVENSFNRITDFKNISKRVEFYQFDLDKIKVIWFVVCKY